MILGGSRQDNNWSAEVDMALGDDILKRCCELCPELGSPEDLQVISHNVGLRRKCFPVVVHSVIHVEQIVDGTCCSFEERRTED